MRPRSSSAIRSTAQQVARVSAAVAGEVEGLPAYPIYALMVDFLAYSGLRSAENAGLEVGDLQFVSRPGQPLRIQSPASSLTSG